MGTLLNRGEILRRGKPLLRMTRGGAWATLTLSFIQQPKRIKNKEVVALREPQHDKLLNISIDGRRDGHSRCGFGLGVLVPSLSSFLCLGTNEDVECLD